MRMAIAAAMCGVLVCGCQSKDASEAGSVEPGNVEHVMDGAGAEGAGADGGAGEVGRGALDFTMARIDGREESLEVYRGKVVLIVNTASRCGLTGQYEGLQALYEELGDRGFVILGFPSNDFMGQEPGTDAEIAAFCVENYGVSFPMFSKISVKGDESHALFRLLSAETAEPSWNFTKYLLDRDGNVVERFDPRTGPGSPELRSRIEGLLAGA